MPHEETTFWEKAAAAREELLEQYGTDPNIALIDIGCPPVEATADDEVGLRIHMSEAWCAENSPAAATFQAAVDGIPVYVICAEP